MIVGGLRNHHDTGYKNVNFAASLIRHRIAFRFHFVI